MGDVLIILLIMCILFGVAATRELVFGFFSFCFWAIVVILALGAICKIIDECSDKRTPEEKKKDKEKEERQKAAEKAKREPLTWREWLSILLILAFLASPLLLFVIK